MKSPQRKRRLIRGRAVGVLVPRICCFVGTATSAPRCHLRLAGTSVLAACRARARSARASLAHPLPGQRPILLTAFGNGLLEDVAAKLSQLSANHDLEIVPARTLEDKKISTLADAKKEFGVSLGLTIVLELANDMLRALPTA